MRLRLVEQEDVGILREAGGERDQLPLAARERIRRQRELVLREPEVEQHRARPALDARPARRLPALDQLLLPAQDAAHAVEIAGERGGRELVGDAVQLPVELVEVRPRRPHRLRRGPLVAQRVLRQERDDDAAPADARAGIRLLEPGEQPQHRGLARAVRPDDAHAGARLDREGEPVEHGAAAERLADGVEADEGHLAVRGSRRARTRRGRRGSSRRAGRRPRSPRARRAPRTAARPTAPLPGRRHEPRDHRQRLPVRVELPRGIEVVLPAGPPHAEELAGATHRVEPVRADAEPCREPRARERLLR